MDIFYVDQLPTEILMEILIHFELHDLQTFKQLSNNLYIIYNNLLKNKLFVSQLYETILNNNGYITDNNMNIIQIKNLCIKLSPIPGNVSLVDKNKNSVVIKPINLPEQIVNIFQVEMLSFFLSKKNIIYMHNHHYTTNYNKLLMPIPVTDIIKYGSQYVILSKGKIYYGSLLIKPKQRGSPDCHIDLKQLNDIDNIINICLCKSDNTILFHRINGDVCGWGKKDKPYIIAKNVKQLACANVGPILTGNKEYIHSGNEYIIPGRNWFITISPSKTIPGSTIIKKCTEKTSEIIYNNHFINGALSGDHIILIDDKQQLHNTVPESYILQPESIHNVIKTVGFDTFGGSRNLPYKYYVITK